MAARGRRSDGWAASNGIAERVDRPRLVRVGAAANDNRAPALTIVRRLAFAALGALVATALILMWD
ncbi:MAG: hypothetical protein KF889_16130 [Alphaproteobacteria bacterium]|nr:hypothetical protein [Alphaproteobacteria bacterium]MCW5740104.1 hypothetical protein [Alphaproteobacteria bacterium]